MAIEPHVESFLISIILTSVLIAPVVHYLFVGWLYKSNDIITSLPTQAKKRYLALYQQRACDDSDALKIFEEYYWKWYGRRHLVPAAIIVTIVNIFPAYLIGEATMRWITNNNEYAKIPQVAAAGFIGGYIFVVWDFIDRNARRDLSSSDIYRGALRLSTAIAIGWAFGKLAAPSIAPFIAFAAGVFPLPTVQIILRRLLDKQLQLDTDPAVSQELLVKISGINNDISDRIHDADIFTIPQLAYCDPIQLAMHSNLGFNFVNDIVSQALAWVYVENKLDTMRSFGLRGACEIQYFVDNLNDPKDEIRISATSQLAQLSTAVSASDIAIRSCFEQIALDPYTKFLVEAYGEADLEIN